ncbi:hypothetical protein X772_33800 [Mesorhizobium sp. LSJC280B00]|nr:hypothetical protein X772_33800 [Mesorhizobium sp. LSJC280B00]
MRGEMITEDGVGRADRVLIEVGVVVERNHYGNVRPDDCPNTLQRFPIGIKACRRRHRTMKI